MSSPGAANSRSSPHQQSWLADAETVEAQQHGQHDIHSSPLTAMLQPKAFGEMDVMDDENAWTYWSRSDAHAMVMNIGGNPRARAGLCRVVERWVAHLMGVAVSDDDGPGELQRYGYQFGLRKLQCLFCYLEDE